MDSLADIIAKREPIPRKRGTERGELIEFFSLKLERKPVQIGVRLAHYKTPELYALKSAFLDRWNRNGTEAARRYFWWVTKTDKV